MAVQKLKMMQLVAPLEDLVPVVIALFRTGGIHLTDAVKMIENYAFTISVTEENMAKTVDVSTVRNFEKENFTDERRNAALNYLQRKPCEMGDIFAQKNLTTTLTPEQEAVLAGLTQLDQQIEEIKKAQKDAKVNLNLLRLLSANDIEYADLAGLEQFSFAFGTLSEIGRRAIRSAYEKIPAAILHLGQISKEELYLLVYPNKVENEIRRLEDCLSMKCLSPKLPKEKSKEQSVRFIEQKLAEGEATLASLEKEKQTRIHRHEKDLEGVYYAASLGDAVNEAKQYFARGKEYFYVTGWVSDADEAAFRKTISDFKDTFVQFIDEKNVSEKAPTRLHNNALVRPFEAMVNMYGTPNYNELDPTGFFAITYVILFGAMFGDFGQGAIFALLGLLLKKMRHPNLGGVTLCMGLASMAFGLAYGSVFGLEDVIPALVIRPFNNINTVLIAAIVFGVGLSSIAYILGIVNKLRMHDVQEALFGKEGLCGFVLYLSILLLVVNTAVKPILPAGVLTIIILLALAGILFQQPLTNLLMKKRPLYKQAVGDYYVETGFSLLETLISIFSGALSFIRVGAFAINHVGLFMAFSTMGRMMGGAGNVAMLIIGNIVIIGLEGLIVFIQSLRLEYYELFGKYYVGDGKPFVDAKKMLSNH